MSTEALAIASLLITTHLRQGPDCHDFYVLVAYPIRQ